MKWMQATKSSGANVDFLAVLIAAVPVVYRVAAILRELQPEIREWLRASTDRARADVTTSDSMYALLEQVSQLSVDLRLADERMAERMERQDAALVEMLRRITGDDTEHG